LNDKSDDDDLESRAGLKKQNELLQQLLKEKNGDSQPSMNSQVRLPLKFLSLKQKKKIYGRTIALKITRSTVLGHEKYSRVPHGVLCFSLLFVVCRV